MDFVGIKKEIEAHRIVLQKSILSVLGKGDFIEGECVEALESQLKELTGARYCISCASGTDALWLALRAIGTGPGDAVLVSPFSFVASADVISRTGATPVFVDIESNTWCIDKKKIIPSMFFARGIGLNPKAIIGVDIFGVPCDYAGLREMVKETGTWVIADAAQSLGGSRAGVEVGHLADISCTSFFPTKPLGCFGDGGAVFCQNPAISDRIRSLKAHGKGSALESGEARYNEIGINSRLDTIQASVLCAKLEWFKKDCFVRNANAAEYRRELRGVECQTVPANTVSAYAQFGIVSPKRDAIADKLSELGIPSRRYYARGIHEEKAFASLGQREETFPVTAQLCREILCLPIHSYLEDSEIGAVCKAVNTVTG